MQQPLSSSLLNLTLPLSYFTGGTGLGLGIGYGFLRKGQPVLRTAITGAASFFCMSGAYLGIVLSLIYLDCQAYQFSQDIVVWCI